MKIAEQMDWWLGTWRHVIKYSLAQICYDRDERIEVGGWGSGRDTEMYATQQFYWNTILFKCHSAVLLNSNFIQMQQCSFIEIKSYSNATVQFFFHQVPQRYLQQRNKCLIMCNPYSSEMFCIAVWVTWV